MNIVIFFTLIRIATSNYESYIDNKHILYRSKRQAGTCGTSCNDFQETAQLFIFERGNLIVNYGKDSKGCKTADISCKGTGPAEVMTMTLLFTVDGISGEFKELGLTDPTAIPDEITTQLQCTANGSWILDGLAYSNILSCESLYILDCQQLAQVNIEDTNALLPFPHSNSIKGTTQLSTNANDIGEEIQSVEVCKASTKTNYVAILAETTDGQYIVVANEVSYTYAEFVCHKGQLTSNENIPGSFTGKFICQEYEPVTDCTPLDVKQISISDTSLSVPSEINYHYKINQGNMKKKEIVLSTGFKDIQITCQGIDTTKYVIFALKSTDDQNTNIQSGQYAHSALISCKNNAWVTVTGAEVTGEIICDEIEKIEETTTTLVDITTTEACIKCPDPNIGNVVTDGCIKADLNITVASDSTYNCDVLVLSCTSKNGNNNVALLATKQDGTKLDLKYGPYNNKVKIYCDHTGTYKSEAVGGTELTGEFVCEEPSLITTTSPRKTTENNLCNKCQKIEEGVPITNGANAGTFSFTETTNSRGCLVVTLNCKGNNNNDISAIMVQKLDNTYHMLQKGTHEIEAQMICNNDKQWEDKNKVLLLKTVICEQYNVQKTEQLTTIQSTSNGSITEKVLTTTEESTFKYTIFSKLETVVSTSNDIATQTSTESSTIIVSTLTPELKETVTFTDVLKTLEDLSTTLTPILAEITSKEVREIISSTLAPTTSEELTTIVTSTSFPTTSEELTTIETPTPVTITSEELTIIVTSTLSPTTPEELTTIEISTFAPTTPKELTTIEISTFAPTTPKELTTIKTSIPVTTTSEELNTIEISTFAPTTPKELTTIETSTPVTTTSEELNTNEISTSFPPTSEEISTIVTSTLVSTTSEELTTIETPVPTTSEELTTIESPVPTTSEDLTTIETPVPTTSEELTTTITSTLVLTTSEDLTTIETSVPTTSEELTTIETSTLASTTSEELTTIETLTPVPTTSEDLTTIETLVPTTSEELTTIETSTLVPTTSEELTTIETPVPTTSEDLTTIETPISVTITSEELTTIETSTLASTTSEELTTIETSTPVPTTSEDLTTIETPVPTTSEDLTTIETPVPTTFEELTTIETPVPITSEELTTIETPVPTTSEDLTTIKTSVPTTSEELTTIKTSTLASTTSEELTTIESPVPTTSEDLTTIETLVPTTSEELTTTITSILVSTTSEELTTIETPVPTTSEDLTTIKTSVPTTSEELTTIETSTLAPTISEELTTIETPVPTTSEDLTTINTSVSTTSEELTTIETSTLAPTISEELTTIETPVPTTSEDLTTIKTSVPTTSEELTTIKTSTLASTTSEELTTIETSTPVPTTSEDLTTIETLVPTTSEELTTIETSTLVPTTSEDLTTIETLVPTTSEELTTTITSTLVPTTSEELTTIETPVPTTSEELTTIKTSTLASTKSEETTSISPLCDLKNGVWSSWKTILECSDTCGSCGHTIKRRTCLSLQFNISCFGDSEKVDRCNHKPCTFPKLSCCHGLKATVINKEIVCDSLPADEKPILSSSCCPSGGIWGNWENWSSCNGNSCESCGESIRTRECLTDSSTCLCQGDSFETKSCKYLGNWSEWSETIPCTDDCGQCGVRTLERKCLTTGTCACKGASKKTEICGFSPCVFPRDSCCNGTATVLSNQFLCGPLPEPIIEEVPTCVSCCVVGGVWSEWVSEPCTDTCGSCGKQKKTRTCLSGSQCPCTGDSVRNDPCNIEPCTFPRGSCCNGLSAIASTDGTNKIICGPQPIIFDPQPSTVCMPTCCPKYGVWSEWSSQTSCDYTCGTSKRKQIRTCLSEGNGCPCVGSYTKEEYCSTTPCVFPRQSCNEGYKAMVINSNITCGPLPSLEVEEKRATLECNSICCPKYGTWSEWQITKPCEDVCGSCSTETRSRTCLNEDKCPCVGDKTQTYVCKTNPCVFPRDSCCDNYKAMVVNNELICGPLENIKEENPFVNSCDNTCCPNGGMWSDWYDATVCGDTCGSYSNVTQIRFCISEYFGCSCSGNSESYPLLNHNFCKDRMKQIKKFQFRFFIHIIMIAHRNNKLIKLYIYFFRTIPCNTQPCTFPRDSCSPGLKAGVYDGKIQCGPLNLLAAEIIQKTTCCPPDGLGIWGKWGEWSKCDVNSCGGCNKKKRTRICESEKYGCPCTGTNEETEYCSQQPCIDDAGNKLCCLPFSKSIGPTKDTICIVGGALPCPEEGQWSEWSSGTCTDTCGMCGIIKKERTCLTTSQGCDCTGNNVLNTTQTCGELVCSYPRSLCCEGYSRKIVNKKFVCAK
uniref:Scaffoldin n=1 Tax=Strongyloides venezuelensis TaxID=75913 RepID=A0A0K0EXC9_STRVS